MLLDMESENIVINEELLDAESQKVNWNLLSPELNDVCILIFLCNR